MEGLRQLASSGLESLSIEGCSNRFTDHDWTRFNADQLRPLKMLNISHCDNLGDGTIEMLAAECPHLEELYADGLRYLSDSAVEVLAATYTNTLKVLVLDGADLYDRSRQAMTQFTHLEKLSFSFCDNFTDVGVTMLGRLTTIKSLRLRKAMQLTTGAVRGLLLSGALDQLEELDLTECSNIQDDVMLAVAERCPRLRQINISWCWDVTNAGMRAVVLSAPQLLLLNCTGVKRLTDVPFLDVHVLLPQLKVLVAKSANNVSDDVLSTLCDLLPGLIAINYYGDRIGDNPDAAWGSNSTGRIKVHQWTLEY